MASVDPAAISTGASSEPESKHRNSRSISIGGASERDSWIRSNSGVMSAPHHLVVANRANEARVDVLIEVRGEAQDVVGPPDAIGPDSKVGVEHVTLLRRE